MLKTMNRKISVVLILFSAGYLYLSYNLKEYPYVPVDSDLVPKALGFVLIGLAVLLFFDKSSEEEGEKKKRTVPKKEIGVMAAVGGMIFIYILLFEVIGFLLATALFIFFCSWFLGYDKWVSNVLVSLIFPSALYYLFNYLLQIRLPQGILPF
ncbi:tripartite tricarboxylate transporter TctB family protein [Halobacillus yeomjeoni]|uniref:Tripartite tricarboxylate transporter TctB family protein n=1 Tax=Halobacillus yeomjeoni TaxID=311194 RepID=A0A931HWU1_9BACI|nr:tripartite tricarboxylate transporter TctB family protein [Halobacillus yeomjeoni]MBH0230826.1 tripartite tricarboxylate transporter TctB family protein [Halobacillus yeomjeoni]MCA0984735.1 tripartite tricarboxylate transporter TctB family protein [Halobacillus yeomjeoni]